jgi:hypothetical protein
MLIRQSGPLLWSLLHRFALAYPEQATEAEQAHAAAFLESWKQLIPRVRCKCRDEWEMILSEFPPDLKTRQGFAWWTFAAHDRVNLLLGKPLFFPDWSSTHPMLRNVKPRSGCQTCEKP